jgi:SAM-dependent methyltransferase
MSEKEQYPVHQHDLEIHQNRISWDKKPSLQKAYGYFYSLIAGQLDCQLAGIKLEVGSGMGNIKKFIPDCITSDLFPNPWLDRVESIYGLNFPDESVSNLILFDVWHHLEHPANALAEARRVLVPGGKLILMEPAMSFLGQMVYGKCHHEPVGFDVAISPAIVDMSQPESNRYFAAQSSAHRIFKKRELPQLLEGWNVTSIEEITSFAYWGTGGFSGPQLYPDALYPVIHGFDKILGLFDSLLSARLLITLKKV